MVKLPVHLIWGQDFSHCGNSLYLCASAIFNPDYSIRENSLWCLRPTIICTLPIQQRHKQCMWSLPPKMLRYTKLGNSTWFENLLDYGPFRDTPAYSQDAIQVHYANSSPFLTITSTMQVIKVSHWDNIAAEANVDLKHTGLYLGPFPLDDDQRQPESGLSSIRSFKTIPADAQDVITRMRLALFSLDTSLFWITPWRWKYSLPSLFCWVKDPIHWWLQPLKLWYGVCIEDEVCGPAILWASDRFSDCGDYAQRNIQVDSP